MKVAVIGTGYVGLVTAACLADSGHKVIAVDKDAKRVNRILRGDIPIFEPGLEKIVNQTISKGHFTITTDPAELIKDAEVFFIAVGTPTNPEDGSADISQVRQVASTLGELIHQDCVVVNKSTVPLGTRDLVQGIIDEKLKSRGMKIRCEVTSNPEFLKEGSAIEDFLKPDRIIIGCKSDYAEKKLRKLYQPFNRNHEKIIVMDPTSAELTKYAANCMLATKISFINQLANIAESSGANIEMVRRGIGSDPRIGSHFIYPGMGYGGSCFPKDVRALIHTMKEHGLECDLLESVEHVNERQKTALFSKIDSFFSGELKGVRFAVWGLAFKPNTDDMREAPSIEIMRQLVNKGALITAYDPQASENCKSILGDINAISYADSAEVCIENCDALIVCTEWMEFRSPDWNVLANKIAKKVVFDGRNIYIDQHIDQYGLNYYAIGLSPGL